MGISKTNEFDFDFLKREVLVHKGLLKEQEGEL